MDVNKSVINQNPNQNANANANPNSTNNNPNTQSPQQPTGSVPFYTNPAFYRPVGVAGGSATIPQRKQIPMITPPPKTKKTYGFFRTLMLIILVLIALFMIAESIGIVRIAFELPEVYPTGLIYFSSMYPYLILLCTLILRTYKKIRSKVIGIFLWIILGCLVVTGLFYKTQKPDTHIAFNNQFSYKLHDIITPTQDSEVRRTPSNLYVHIQGIAGNYTISGKDMTHTIQGVYMADRGLSVTRDKTDEKMTIQMIEEPTRNITQWINSRRHTNIHPDFILDLYVKTFWGDIDVDLKPFIRNTARIHLGIGNTTIHLGDNTQHASQLQINGLRSDITVIVPKDIGVILKIGKIYSTLNIPDFMQRDSSTYQSNNYDTAEKKIQISISQGIGNITIISQ